MVPTPVDLKTTTAGVKIICLTQNNQDLSEVTGFLNKGRENVTFLQLAFKLIDIDLRNLAHKTSIHLRNCRTFSKVSCICLTCCHPFVALN